MTSAPAKKTRSATLPSAGSAASRSFGQVLAGQPTVTLQQMVLSQQGVCTEPRVFYNFTDRGWVSESTKTVFLPPKAGLQTDTFGNMLGLGNWARACLLDGLFLAILGSGTVEIKVFQAVSGRSPERLVCEVVELSPGDETVIDLSHVALLSAEGALWFELTNCSVDDTATVTGARYLTRGRIEPGLKLALCLPKAPEASPGDDLVRERLRLWAGTDLGRAVSAELVETPSATPALAQLNKAKADGFSHAVVMDPTSLVDRETLDRCVVFLSHARGPHSALGAAVLDKGDNAMMGANGMTRDLHDKPMANHQGADLSDAAQVVEMESELAADTEDKLLFQPEFLALCLKDLPKVQAGEGMVAFDETLRAKGYRLIHLTGLMTRRDSYTSETHRDLITLQHVIYPEPGLCTEAEMYYHADGPTTFKAATETLIFEGETVVKFDSYFNALNIGKWHETCEPEGLYLGLKGRGRVLVKVFHAVPDRSWELLCNAAYTLSPVEETLIELSHYALTAVTGMIYFELHAVSQSAQLTGARFAVPGRINPEVRLCLSITTFKREAEVENTARRMEAYFKTCDFADQMHLNIVDNGTSANIVESDKITLIPNANLGGAGGFTRGLIEGEKAGYSHVLFMDDDASIPMEALHRAYAFLTLSKDPKAAVSGAMISNSDKWRMWENGAVFDRHCRPQFNGVDLRDWAEVMDMEIQSASYRSQKMYGGWWFFAFPVRQVTRYPFPFFVRGDDINFSLANDFHITTLNGVVSFAEDFSDKESPMTLYLDLRNHFVQHLTLEKMQIGPLNIARIGVGFFLRNIAKFQYETVDALFLAWNDVLKGPEFFVQNADASAQRAAVKALYKVESWKPASEMNLSGEPSVTEATGLRRQLFRWSLNGHLLPFYNLWGRKVLLQPRDRNNFARVWGASQITFLNSTRDKAYTVRQSKLRFLAQSLQLLWLTLRLVVGYRALLAKYRKGYMEITVPGFWQRLLKLT